MRSVSEIYTLPTRFSFMLEASGRLLVTAVHSFCEQTDGPDESVVTDISLLRLSCCALTSSRIRMNQRFTTCPGIPTQWEAGGR
jgi:hypothetical protein